MDSSNYHISTDKNKLDIPLIHSYLAEESYWAQNIPITVVEKSILHSLCFGVYQNNNSQVGFARIISDRATFAYLADVFILKEHRGNGLSKLLMQFIHNYSDLQGLRRWMLATKDAQELYKQFGFTALAKPERIMEITNSDIYKNTLV